MEQGIIVLPANFASAVRGRVQALAMAHRLLGEGTWTGLDLSKLVAAETPIALRERVSRTNGLVPLPALLVQPMALVLHELMSNAQQNGALSGTSGTGEIDWTYLDGQLHLTWRERAPGSGGTQEGGRRLQADEGSGPTPVGGQLGMEWLPNGVQVVLDMPLGNEQALG